MLSFIPSLQGILGIWNVDMGLSPSSLESFNPNKTKKVRGP